MPEQNDRPSSPTRIAPEFPCDDGWRLQNAFYRPVLKERFALASVGAGQSPTSSLFIGTGFSSLSPCSETSSNGLIVSCCFLYMHGSVAPLNELPKWEHSSVLSATKSIELWNYRIVLICSPMVAYFVLPTPSIKMKIFSLSRPTPVCSTITNLLVV